MCRTPPPPRASTTISTPPRRCRRRPRLQPPPRRHQHVGLRCDHRHGGEARRHHRLHHLRRQGGAHTFEIDFLKSSTANQWNAEIARRRPAMWRRDQRPSRHGHRGLQSRRHLGYRQHHLADQPRHRRLHRWGGGSLGWRLRGARSNGGDEHLDEPASVTQYDSASTTTGNTADGGPAGTLTGVTIAKDGTVSAAFSNGATRTVAKVALATFVNPDGLQAISRRPVSSIGGQWDLHFEDRGTGGSGRHLGRQPRSRPPSICLRSLRGSSSPSAPMPLHRRSSPLPMKCCRRSSIQSSNLPSNNSDYLQLVN